MIQDYDGNWYNEYDQVDQDQNQFPQPSEVHKSAEKSILQVLFVIHNGIYIVPREHLNLILPETDIFAS